MERASRPTRIFENNIMVPFDIVRALGNDIISRYFKLIPHENVLYIEEIHYKQDAKKTKYFLLSDLRVIYANVKKKKGFSIFLK
jgi:hypothetical protein